MIKPSTTDAPAERELPGAGTEEVTSMHLEGNAAERGGYDRRRDEFDAAALDDPATQVLPRLRA
jgi:hypothetical protein